MKKSIKLTGVRTHNLKNIDIAFPHNQLTVVTGLSGSGKSSLVFDTLYAEGQRRYVESLSAYARQFLNIMDKPDIESVEGLSPSIAIDQKSTSHNPRSTVGTITEIYDYLRLLYARAGVPHCPHHHYPLVSKSIKDILEDIHRLPEGEQWMILAPVVRGRKGEYSGLMQEMISKGLIRGRINGEVKLLEEVEKLDRYKQHTIEIVVDRFRIKSDMDMRLTESLEYAFKLSAGIALLVPMNAESDDHEMIFSNRYACPYCDYTLKELEPKLFSFNSPAGACPECNGLGVCEKFSPDLIIVDDRLSIREGALRFWTNAQSYYHQQLLSVLKHFKISPDKPFNRLSESAKAIIFYGSDKSIKQLYINEKGNQFEKNAPFEGVIGNLDRRYRETQSEAIKMELRSLINISQCSSCQGMRLNESARSVIFSDRYLHDIVTLSILGVYQFFEQLSLSGNQKSIATPILKEIRARLRFLVDVGLDYISLHQSAGTLSGGEAQRIRLASQIGSGLIGVTYILDEPSIGLHQRDNYRLIQALKYLRDLGNTVIVVEHDEEMMREADHIVDIGPLAGNRGGEVVAEGDMDTILNNPKSMTAQYLSGNLSIKSPKYIPINRKRSHIRLKEATGNNLKSVNLNVPLECFVCITGVSGSGKSTLINQTLYPVVYNKLVRSGQHEMLGIQPYKSIEGLEHINKVIDIDQSPIGRTPRSNPATYCGIFSSIREIFSDTQEARMRGYQPGRFSFNVAGGRCERCEGAGLIRVEMHFMSDVYVVCESCEGKRYNQETLQVLYKGKSIYDILEMNIEEANLFFESIPSIKRKLDAILSVGLGYLKLGHSATHLSGGEAQRIKLAKELAKRDTGQTLYILDEPTTGLHFYDVDKLLKALFYLRDQGNSIVVIEHNLDVIACADWIIDLGPEGGNKGGTIIAEGNLKTLINTTESYTGIFLKKTKLKK